MKRAYGTRGTADDGVGRSSALFGDDMADRVQWVSNEHEAAGKSFKITDGFRPDGVPADYWVDNPSETSTGGFNQWYAIGQHRRRGAAYAAPVGGSDHAKTAFGQGAVDCDVQDLDFRREKMGAVGLIQTDSSETWHFAIRYAPASWWDRSKVVYPGSNATPATAPKPKDLKKESTTMTRLYQEDGRYQADKKDGKIFVIGGGGAGYVNDPNIVNQIIEMNARAGLTGPCWTEVEKVPWNWITNLSQCLQEGSLATAILAETRSLTGTPQKPGILRRIANFLKI